MLPNKICIIGLGLIGGSIARTVRRIHPEIEIIAYNRGIESRKEALADGVIDKALDGLGEEISDCDYVFLCAPVLINDEYLVKLRGLIGENTIVTDIGSVKAHIHEIVSAYPELEKHFIGGHPMCGTEHSGYSFSTDYMLENAYYVITPSRTVPGEKVDDFEEFVGSIGAIPIILDYKEHDHIVGTVSHLPHIISATLVNLVKDSDGEDEMMKTIAAGGFKDITRISSSSPDMLENICLTNSDTIVEMADKFIASMKEFRDSVAKKAADDISARFHSAKDYRDSFTIPHSGPIKRTYLFFCDLIDEAGGIASIATILAANNISIKNIGIIHNREYEQGVLQIEVYEEQAYKKAVEILRKYHYTVYERHN